MGNLCSRSANEPDHFSGQGRVLGSGTQATPSSAPVPQKITTSGPGRTLGSREGEDNGGNAKSAAARAAEERVSKSSKTGGKLSTQLAGQKKQTQNQLLNAGSEQERRNRDADQSAEARNWN